MVYVDTSAFLDVLDADDAFHKAAVQVWQNLVNEDDLLYQL